MATELEIYFNNIYGGGNDEYIENTELNISLEELMGEPGDVDYKEFFEEKIGGGGDPDSEFFEEKNDGGGESGDEFFEDNMTINSLSGGKDDSDNEYFDGENSEKIGGDEYFEEFNKYGGNDDDFFDKPIDDAEYFENDNDEYFENDSYKGGKEYDPYNPNFSEAPTDEIVRNVYTDEKLAPLKEKNDKVKDMINKQYINIKDTVTIKSAKDVIKYLDL